MKFLHTMIRVVDLDKSIEFYTKVLGMSVLDRFENQEYRYSLVFVGSPDQPDGATIELTYNWDTGSYDLGNAFGHMALGCEDIYAACEKNQSAWWQRHSRTRPNERRRNAHRLH